MSASKTPTGTLSHLRQGSYAALRTGFLGVGYIGHTGTDPFRVKLCQSVQVLSHFAKGLGLAVSSDRGDNA